MQDNGHLNLLSHDSFAAGVPHETFARMRREEPLHWTDGDAETKGFWSLTRHADILLANRPGSVFSSAQGIRLEDQSREEYLARRTFQETDAPEHTTVRRAVNPSFAKPVMAAFEPLIRELASGIMDKALAQSEFDAVEAIAKQLPMMMLGRILGVPDADLDWLVEKGDALIGNSDPDFTDHVIDKMDTDAYRLMPFRSPAGVALYDYADDLLENRRTVAEEGILAKMMRDENGLDALAFKNFFCLLVAAGNDTTRYSIAMALNLLAHDPTLIAALRTGTYWETCADEFIRLASPTMHFVAPRSRMSNFTGIPFVKATRCFCGLSPAAAMRPSLTTPTPASLGVTPTAIWPSGRAEFTSASACIWPSWRSASPWRSSSNALTRLKRLSHPRGPAPTSSAA